MMMMMMIKVLNSTFKILDALKIKELNCLMFYYLSISTFIILLPIFAVRIGSSDVWTFR